MVFVSFRDPKSMLRKLRLIHLVFIVSIPLCAWVAQSSCPSNSSDWTLWHWVITGLAVYSAFVGFFYRRKLMRSSEAALRGDASSADRQYGSGGSNCLLWSSLADGSWQSTFTGVILLHDWFTFAAALEAQISTAALSACDEVFIFRCCHHAVELTKELG
jgi:hypothetical protein